MNMKKILLALTLVALPGLVVRSQETASTNVTGTASTMVKQGYDGYNDNNYVGHFGAGITLGEPIGGSVKYWFNDSIAVDGALGWSSHDHADVYLHSDLLWHDFHLFPVSSGRLPIYFGGGVLARFRSGNYGNQVGIRVPVGVSYMFDNIPVDIFAEVAPALDVSPFVRGEITGGVGIRYWF